MSPNTGKITAIVFWYEMHMDMEGAGDKVSPSVDLGVNAGDVILTNWPESIPPLGCIIA